MANKKISDFTPTTAINSGDLFELENTGNNSRKVTAANLASALQSVNLTRPSAASFTRETKSNGGETVSIANNDDSNGVIFKMVPNNTGNRGAFEGLAVTTGVSFTVKARLLIGLPDDNTGVAGLAIQEDTDTDRMFIGGLEENNDAFGPRGTVYALTDMSTIGLATPTTYTRFSRPGSAAFLWHKIEYDGTDLTYFMGMDGVSWLPIRSVAKADLFTGTINYAGFGAFTSAVATTNEIQIFCDHFEVTYP